MEKEEIRIKQRYKIEKVLGQGGFGVTYLAYDEELCQEVVLKSIVGNMEVWITK